MMHGFSAVPCSCIVQLLTLQKNGVKPHIDRHRYRAWKYWLCTLLKGNPITSVRKPEATSVHRILGFKEYKVILFFKSVKGLMPKYKFSPTRICNVDETGTLRTRPYLTLAGQKRIKSVTSWQRGKEGLLILCCECSWHFNAFDIYLFSTVDGLSCGKSYPSMCDL